MIDVVGNGADRRCEDPNMEKGIKTIKYRKGMQGWGLVDVCKLSRVSDVCRT